MESTTFQAIKAEGKIEGRREALGDQLRRLLGTAAEPLIPRLLLCTPETSIARAGSSFAAEQEILGELERLLPRGEVS